jgi:tRNA threonylcarbamoyladenosine biosynthesis protein TsaE
VTPYVTPRATSHVTRDEEETRELAADLARRLAPGAVVLLQGELGAGKTAFVKGLAGGLGLDPGDVSSPSFALVHEYGPSGGVPVLVHADLYRIPAGASVEDLGLEERGSAILAVEWPGPALTSRPAWRVSITFGEGGARRIDVTPPEDSVTRASR